MKYSNILRANMFFVTLKQKKTPVGRRRKVTRPLRHMCFRGFRDCHAKLEWKDLTRGTTEHVYKGKIGAEGLPDFPRGLGKWNSIVSW